MKKLIGDKLKTDPKFCPQCGEENVENANFCLNCGTSLETIESGQTQDKIDIKSVILRDDSNQMDSLNLTPAESLMILDNEKYSNRTSLMEILRVTLIDLVFKNVFKIDIQEEVNSITSRIIKEIYLQEGKFFNMPLKPHEEIFREYLSSRDDSNKFSTLQALVLRDALQQEYVKKRLLEPLLSDGFLTLKKSILRKKYVLSDKGIETKQIIEKLINDGRNLDEWLETDPQRAKAYMLISGSNIFLIDKQNLKWFKNNSGRINKLFAGRKVHTDESDFFNYYWYSTFILDSGIVDISSIDDLFSDFNISTILDLIDASDFGFNVTGSDDGIFDSDSGFDSGFDSGNYDSGSYDGGGFDSGSYDSGGYDGGGGDSGGGCD